MRIKATVATAALSLSALVPLAAAADEQTAYTVSPIAVKSCSVNQGDIVTPYPSSVRTAAGIRITFANTSSARVSDVEFVARYNGQLETIADKGNFAPNVTIAHDLNAFSDAVSSGGDATCTVAKVEFSDGTSWQAPVTNVASAPLTADVHR